MSTRILLKKQGLNQRGAVMIEFAIVVSLLLIILFGILEFSFTFLQHHFVANAAREGVRVGVRAQNYNCFDAASIPCTGVNLSDRGEVVKTALSDCTTNPKGYLCTLYEKEINLDNVAVHPERILNPDGTKTLKVSVTVPNFFPPLLTGLVPGYKHPNPDLIEYQAIGNYENADEQ